MTIDVMQFNVYPPVTLIRQFEAPRSRPRAIALGFDLEDSLVLRHPDGGPLIYLIEQPQTDSLEIRPIVSIEDSATFTPPAAGTVTRGFEPQHWGVLEMLILGPDHRPISVQGPLPQGVEAPEGHG